MASQKNLLINFKYLITTKPIELFSKIHCIQIRFSLSMSQWKLSLLCRTTEKPEHHGIIYYGLILNKFFKKKIRKLKNNEKINIPKRNLLFADWKVFFFLNRWSYNATDCACKQIEYSTLNCVRNMSIWCKRQFDDCATVGKNTK